MDDGVNVFRVGATSINELPIRIDFLLEAPFKQQLVTWNFSLQEVERIPMLVQIESSEKQPCLISSFSAFLMLNRSQSMSSVTV
jgi:hypothetical protein